MIKAAAVLLVMCSALVARAQVQVIVTVGNGSGVSGGTADVPVSVANTGGVVVTVGFDLLFDDALLDSQATTCQIAARLGNRSVTTFSSPGRLRFLLTDLMLRPIDDGEIATCTFRIRGTAAVDATTDLILQNLDVDDNSVPSMRLPSNGVNGSVAVQAAPTEVPTATPTETVPPPTNTPVPPTNTPLPPTNTPVPPTNTPIPPTSTPVPPTSTAVPPTSTKVPPTSTRVPATATNTVAAGSGGGGGSGCTIAAPRSGAVGSAVWLIVPAALLVCRRRRVRR